MKNKKGSVLFVDDERNILRTLKREFLHADFNSFLATSAEKALEYLEKMQIDLMVTDVKMPEMNGIELLAIVRKKHPNVERIILSGYVEKEEVLKALNRGMVTTYFAKPWDGKVLQGKIEKILDLKKAINNTKLVKILNTIDHLPSLPESYRDFVQAVQEGKSLKHLTDIISRDSSIVTKVLHITNSAFYSGSKVSSLENAVSLLGLDELKQVVFSTTIVNEFHSYVKDLKFLYNYMNIANIKNRFLKTIYQEKYSAKLPEEYSLIGLLYNLGYIILYYFSKTFEKIEDYMKINDLEFYDFELSENNLGVTHQEVGAFVLNYWDLPFEYSNFALNHHNEDKLTDDEKNILKILNAIDIIYTGISMENEWEEIKSKFKENNIETEGYEKYFYKIKELLDEKDRSQ